MELVLFACLFAMLFYVVAQTVRVAQKSVSANKKPPSLPRLYSIPIELDVRKEFMMSWSIELYRKSHHSLHYMLRG